MARQINIVEALGLANARPYVVLEAGKPGYEIDTAYVTALRIQALSKDEERNEDTFFDDVIEIALGKKALKEIKAIQPPLSAQAYSLLFEAIMAGIGGEELDSVATRFQDEEPA